MRSLPKFFGVVVFMLLSWLANAGPSKVLDTLQEQYSLNEDVWLLIDSNEAYSPKEVYSGALDFDFKNPSNLSSFIQTGNTYWGRVTIDNQLEAFELGNQWILAFNNKEISYLDLFIKEDANWKTQRGGSFFPDLNTKHATTRLNEFLVSIPPQSQITLYFRLKDYSGITQHQFDFQLLQPSYRNQQLNLKRYLSIMVMGALLIMLIYNLILSWSLKEQIYLIYASYLFFMLIYIFHSSIDFPINGLEQFVFQGNPKWRLMIRVNYYFVVISYLSFINHFLNLKELLPTWLKVFKGLIYLGIGFFILDFSVLYFTNYNMSYSNQLIGIYLIFIAGSILTFLFSLVRTKNRKRVYIIGGTLSMSIGVFIAIFNLIIGNFTAWNLFFIQICVLIEIGFFSAGLADQQRVIEEEKSKAIREKDLEDLRTRLYTNFTHEFRTPLTVINGLSEEILSSPYSDTPRKVQYIQKNGKRMLALVNRIMTLRKLESGEIDRKEEPGDIALFFNYLTESFQALAIAKKIRLVFFSDPGRIPMMFDEEHMQQILTNLLSNAIKHTPNRGKIKVGLFKDDEQLTLKVSDSGPGIPSQEKEKIFEHFYQIMDQHTNIEGSGIGLTIVKELVHQMKGQITVTNLEEGGAQFIITFPIRAIPDKQISSLKSFSAYQPIPIDDQSFNNHTNEGVDLPTLLIVEDNQDLIYYLQVVLNGNYTIHLAYDGEDGFHQAKQLIPDIIISDLMMPKMDGYELCSLLKADADTCHIPIIMLTARPSIEDKIKGFDVGVDAYISKPFNKWELITRLVQLRESQSRLQKKYANSGLPSLNQVTNLSASDLEFVQVLQQIIAENYADDTFDVKSLTDKMAMSRTNLYRKIKRTTKYTASEWIRNTRLNKAKELLESTNRSVHEIAHQVGYKDHSHFTRLYSQNFGELPKDAR